LHLRGWSRGRARARAQELLTLVGLRDRQAHLPEALSGGQRQRVAIARALAAEPPILLGDEPTGNLDTTTGGEILQLLGELHVRLGATILIVTHDAQVASWCHRTISVRDGHILQDVVRVPTSKVS